MEENKIEVLKSISKAMKQIPAIGKNNTNVTQKFKYRSIDDLVDGVSKIIADNDLILTFETLSNSSCFVDTKSGKAKDAEIKVRYTFLSSLDGSKVECTIIAVGRDHSDKAELKAYTNAFKTLLGQVFCIKFNEDPDVDYIENQQKSKPVVESKPVMKKPKKTIFQKVDETLKSFDKDNKRIKNGVEEILDGAFIDNLIEKVKQTPDDNTLKQAIELLEKTKESLNEQS